MIIKANKAQEINYREEDAVSQSYLKALYKKGFKHKDDKEKGKGLSLGSLLDSLMFYSQSDFDTMYYVSQTEGTIPDAIVKILKEYHNKEIQNDEVLLSIINKNNYRQSNKEETRLRNVKEYNWFLDELKDANNRTIVNLTDFTNVMILQNGLLGSKKTEKYFNDSKRFYIIYQVPLYFEYKGIKCKALLDGLFFDRVANEAYLFDLKSMNEPPWKASIAYNKYRYDIQASWYQLAIKQIGINNILAKYDIHTDVRTKLLNPRIIFSSFSVPNSPLVTIVPGAELTRAMYGNREIKYNNDILRYSNIGIDQLLEMHAYTNYHKEEFINSFDHMIITHQGLVSGNKKWW